MVIYEIEASKDGVNWHTMRPEDPDRMIEEARQLHDEHPLLFVRIRATGSDVPSLSDEVIMSSGKTSNAVESDNSVVLFSIPAASRMTNVCKTERLARMLRQDLTGTPTSIPWATPSERDLHRQAVERTYQRLWEPHDEVGIWTRYAVFKHVKHHVGSRGEEADEWLRLEIVTMLCSTWTSSVVMAQLQADGLLDNLDDAVVVGWPGDVFEIQTRGGQRYGIKKSCFKNEGFATNSEGSQSTESRESSP